MGRGGPYPGGGVPFRAEGERHGGERMIKLFASDLDGTLLNAFHNVDRTIARAIREVTDAGAHVVIATGRTMLSNREHGFDGLPVEICGSNGAIVVGREGILKTFPVSPELLELLVPAFPGICFDCVLLDGTYATGSRELRDRSFDADPPLRRIALRGMREAMAATMHFDTPLSYLLEHEVYKVNCRVPDRALGEELEAFVARAALRLHGGRGRGLRGRRQRHRHARALPPCVRHRQRQQGRQGGRRPRHRALRPPCGPAPYGRHGARAAAPCRLYPHRVIPGGGFRAATGGRLPAAFRLRESPARAATVTVSPGLNARNRRGFRAFRPGDTVTVAACRTHLAVAGEDVGEVAAMRTCGHRSGASSR